MRRVAIIDADDFRAGFERNRKFAPVVDFNQRSHAELACQFPISTQLRRIENRHNQQDGIGPMAAASST